MYGKHKAMHAGAEWFIMSSNLDQPGIARACNLDQPPVYPRQEITLRSRLQLISTSTKANKS